MSDASEETTNQVSPEGVNMLAAICDHEFERMMHQEKHQAPNFYVGYEAFRSQPYGASAQSMDAMYYLRSQGDDTPYQAAGAPFPSNFGGVHSLMQPSHVPPVHENTQHMYQSNYFYPSQFAQPSAAFRQGGATPPTQYEFMGPSTAAKGKKKRTNRSSKCSSC